ncbi:MAG TPA: alcohol dehydrogenase catalytic domain-containing protein [Longimicrobiales bacterium]
MKRAELLRPGVVEMRELPEPRPGAGEVVVKIEAALTCGTDIKTYQRGHPKIPLPAPLGHEFSGVISAVGDGVERFREGDAVACTPTAPCGACRLCERGHDSLCAQAVGRILLGAFAEYITVPAHIVRSNMFERPPSLSAEEAAVLEPLACVMHGADRVLLERAERVIIVGDGPIALLFGQVALLRGAEDVMLFGKHDIRLRAAEAVGLNAIDVGDADIRVVARDLTDGVGADVVVECVGRPELWEAAFDCVATAGELLAFGGCAAGTRATFDTYRLHYEEVDVKGAFHYGRADVRHAYDLLLDQDIDAGILITHYEPLERLQEALELVLSRQAIKVAVQP